MNNKILWISLCAPYDGVAHGGGNTHNYYLKQVHQSKKFDIHLITFCEMEEYEKVKKDHDLYGINSTIIPWTHEINLANIKRKLQLINTMHNPLNQYGGATNEYYWDKIRQALCKMEKRPDIIILQWTEMVLFCDKIKNIFPKAKVVAIEEDVKFLSLKRIMENEKNFIRRMGAYIRFRKLYVKEIEKLAKCDLVITYSDKDRKLIDGHDMKKILVLAPYFQNYNLCKRSDNPSNDIMFYGAMSRRDNYESAIWFIQNVLNKLDPCIRFVVVGNKPDPKLKEYASDRVLITGYVEDVRPYFERSMCFVAPLVTGAGIKIKVLEALSSGIPVLTNDIGMEGINAEDRRDYIRCTTAEDYISAINKIMQDTMSLDAYRSNAKKFIEDNYSLDHSAAILIDSLEKILT